MSAVYYVHGSFFEWNLSSSFFLRIFNWFFCKNRIEKINVDIITNMCCDILCHQYKVFCNMKSEYWNKSIDEIDTN